MPKVIMEKVVPDLRVVMEHITTEEGVAYAAQGGTLAATITTHHLILNRNHLLVGGIKPHYYCLPVAKREKHRLALRRAATSGHPAYFLGTDSAPHIDALKEHACGCAGCFTATNTMPLLAHVFEEDGALDRLEAFTSLNGAAFYGMPPNEARITLAKSAQATVFPSKIQSEAGPVTVFDPGFAVHWHVEP
jgi:dihydroorotase